MCGAWSAIEHCRKMKTGMMQKARQEWCENARDSPSVYIIIFVHCGSVNIAGQPREDAHASTFFFIIKKQIKERVCRMQWNVGWCSTLLCCQQTLHRPTALYFAQRCPIFFPFLVGPKCPLASTNYMFFGEFLYQTNYEVMHTNKVGSYSGLPVSQIKRVFCKI